jgi:hypothetical protein
MNFTKDEKNIIAEFVFSFQTDVLIVSDAERLVEVLAKHGLITDKENWCKRISDKDGSVCSELFEVVGQKIPDEQGKEIMDEYYGRK